MECCYQPNCEEYAVTPMLVTPSCSPKYCEEEPASMPCLPRCPKPVYYCCTKEVPKRDCCPHSPQTSCRPRSTPPRHEQCPPPREDYNSCCTRQPPPPPVTTCCTKPVKTKYIIPCYRYEDGRITNQPTVLMRRACEVACGTRVRRKPFVVSSYSADPDSEIRRYHSEDERGNCCFHFERKEPRKNSDCPPCTSYPACQPCYSDCVYARAVDSPSCCYYCT